MKKLEKMSLANVKGKLSRKEMSNIMAGSGIGNCGTSRCSVYSGGSTSTGNCVGYQSGNYVTCYCNALNGMNPITSNGGMSRCWN